MNRLRTITIPCTLLPKSGGEPGEGVPYRWLESWVQEISAQIPDEQEKATCRVFGTEHLTASYEHRLSDFDAMKEDWEQARAKLAALKNLLHPDGTLAGSPQAVADAIKAATS